MKYDKPWRVTTVTPFTINETPCFFFSLSKTIRLQSNHEVLRRKNSPASKQQNHVAIIRKSHVILIFPSPIGNLRVIPTGVIRFLSYLHGRHYFVKQSIVFEKPDVETVYTWLLHTSVKDDFLLTFFDGIVRRVD